MKILITGASRGIGLAEAKLLLKKSNELFLLAKSLNSFKGKNLENAQLFGYDLSKESEIQKFVNDIYSKTKVLDVLINNVGIMILKRFEKMADEEINLLLNVNLRSHLLLTKNLLPLLRESNNPQIVFMSSMAAKSSIIGESIYSATKGALTNFADVLRNEFSGKIKISTIHSWGVNTWGAKNHETLLKPENIAEVVEFIVTREKPFLIESIEVGNINQWRGGNAPWSPR